MKYDLSEFQAAAEAMTGWVHDAEHTTAEQSSLLLWANAFDPKNPLYHDPEYGKNTRWGSMIGAPLYEEVFTLTTWNAPVPSGFGHPSHGYAGVPFMIGEEWEFERPVLPNERFRIWRNTPELTKDQSDDSDGITRFTLKSHDVTLFDEQGSKVAETRCYLRMWLSDYETLKREPHAHIYSEEDIQRIRELYNAEIIRGKTPRFAEDVQIGDLLQPAVLGPTTIWDMLVFSVGRQDQKLLPMLELQNQPNGPSAPDPVTGVPKCFMECHIANDTAHSLGLPNAIHAGAVDRSLLMRLATNWMGDDGFVTSFHWQPLADTFVGDTLFASGEVKDIDTESGICLVHAELNNQCGVRTANAQIKIRLPKRSFQ